MVNESDAERNEQTTRLGDVRRTRDRVTVIDRREYLKYTGAVAGIPIVARGVQGDSGQSAATGSGERAARTSGPTAIERGRTTRGSSPSPGMTIGSWSNSPLASTRSNSITSVNRSPFITETRSSGNRTTSDDTGRVIPAVRGGSQRYNDKHPVLKLLQQHRRSC